QAQVVVADMVAHTHGARREDGEIRAALALQLELRAFEALADFVVGHLQRRLRRLLGGLLDVVDLVLAPAQQVLGLGRVVAVAIDDHDTVAEDCGLVSRFRRSYHFAARTFYERRNRDTSSSMILVWLWIGRSYERLAARLVGTSNPPH